ncbi:MAG: SGNH/GDSL hydrolase family protein, partial [Bdellovibrionales bacterium]|nr:SGNH/GDSL hydrolase family protein [Bdellovibrionales bacterium]
RPGLDVRFQRVPVRTNSCGMRGPDAKVAKPLNTYRIMMLGDSFTFGWGVDEDKIFARVLEDNLNRISSNSTTFEVLNLGIPGYSTFQEVAKYLESYTDFEPDALLVYFISNDFGLPFFVKDLVDPAGGIAPVNEFAALQHSKKHKQSAMAYQNELVIDPNVALRKLSDYARTRGIALHVAINPRKGWKTNFDKLWVLKKRPDIKVIKLRRGFMEAYERMNVPESDLTLPNDPHPSALRHKMLGDLLTPYFMEYTHS